MSMPGKQQVKTSMSGLPVDLRRVGQQHRKCARRNVARSFLEVVDPIEVCVVDASQVDALAAARKRVAVVQQHSDSHVFETRHHPDRIVVAENRVHRPFDARAYVDKPFDCRFVWPKGCAAIVAGEDANVVFERRQDVDQALHGDLVHVDVQVADMKDRKPLELRWQRLEPKVGVLDFHALRIPDATPVEAA